MRGADLNVAKLSPGTGEKSLEGEVYIVSALASWKGDARRNPGVNSECLNTSYDVCDLLNRNKHGVCHQGISETLAFVLTSRLDYQTG